MVTRLILVHLIDLLLNGLASLTFLLYCQCNWVKSRIHNLRGALIMRKRLDSLHISRPLHSIELVQRIDFELVIICL